jgi:hypothetical protein
MASLAPDGPEEREAFYEELFAEDEDTDYETCSYDEECE